MKDVMRIKSHTAQGVQWREFLLKYFLCYLMSHYVLILILELIAMDSSACHNPESI